MHSHTLRLTATLVLLFFTGVLSRLSAQEVLSVKGNVALMNHIDNKVEELKNAEEVLFGMGTVENMTKAKAEIDQIRMGPGEEWEKEDKVKKIRSKYKITSKTRGTKKTFKKEVMADMALLFVTQIDSRTSEVIMMRPGQTEYRVEIRVERLGEAIGTGKAQLVSIKGGGGADADDGNERIKINIHLLPGSARSDARMIIQPYLVDCVSEDTVMNCEPVVFEGKKYHSLQNRRMAFNYTRNDILAKYFHNSVLLEDEGRVDFDTMLVVPKPDKKRTYKGPYTYTFEDYHHVYEEDGFEGTCLKPRPFKLLDFSPALANLKLTSEFYEEAESKIQNKAQDLSLSFEVGSDVLLDDPENERERDKLLKELQSYGSDLVNPVIEGGASPDGSRSTNEALARKRAERAKAMFRPFLPSTIRISTTTKVYSWTDVVDELKRRGAAEEVEAMTAILSSGRGDEIGLTRAMKAIPTYATVIEPVLTKFRTMKCKYRVVASRVLTPEEVVDEFHKNKKLYISGEKHFSNGDYYNLFTNIEDSLELDELTYMAYRDITSEEEYQNISPMAPYVCNRMALLNLKRGLAKSSVLDPFIDYSRQKINAKKGISETNVITVNRREICINQAVTYYQLQQMDSARHLIHLVEAAGVQDKNLEMLKHFMRMKELHFKDRTPEEQVEYNKAKDIVLGVSDENKAILYTEIDEWDMRDKGREWVAKMDDGNPKKWYLKGILAADKLLNKKTDDLTGDDSEAADEGDDGGDSGNGDDPWGSSSSEEEAETTATNGGSECYPRVDPAVEQMLIYDKSEAYFKGYMAAKQQYMDTHNGQLPSVGECLGTATGSGAADSSAAPADSTAVGDESGDAAISAPLGEGIPDYLVYFHHAFQMEKSYKKFYAAEGHIPEKLRKQYKYLKKDKAAYEALFPQLKQRDEEEARRLKNKSKKAAKKAAATDATATGADAADESKKE